MGRPGDPYTKHYSRSGHPHPITKHPAFKISNWNRVVLHASPSAFQPASPKLYMGRPGDYNMQSTFFMRVLQPFFQQTESTKY